MNIKCGELNFKITYDYDWDIPKNVAKFAHGNEESSFGENPEVNYNIEFKDMIKQDNRQIISTKQEIIVGCKDNLETRYLFIRGAQYPYAKYTELDENNISVEVVNAFKDMFDIDTMFWSLFALERHMIKKDAVVLHCAYTVYKDHAILFSGPSGIGKSTQANLWEKNRNAQILNGDKSLLLKQDGVWCADGWPVCGSSEICVNKRTKLGSIVFLNQGKENTVVKLSKSNAVKKIISQLTVNYWNLDFVDKAFTLAEDIANDINVYELTCTPDVSAVEALEGIFKEGEPWIL